MAKHELVIIADYSNESRLTLDELCRICGIRIELVHDFILHDVITPTGGHLPEEWLFDLVQLRRIKTALRLQHDLEINLQSAALVLDLLEELETLRAQAKLLEKHFKISKL